MSDSKKNSSAPKSDRPASVPKENRADDQKKLSVAIALGLAFFLIVISVALLAGQKDNEKVGAGERVNKQSGITSNIELANQLSKSRFSRVVWFGRNQQQFDIRRDSSTDFAFVYRGGKLDQVSVYNQLFEVDAEQKKRLERLSREIIDRGEFTVYLPDIGAKKVGETNIYYVIFNEKPNQVAAVSLPEPNYQVMLRSVQGLKILRPGG